MPVPDGLAEWNGQPARARRVTVRVGDSPLPSWWCAKLAGQTRDAVEVHYGGRRFFLDDVDGSGWRKVTDGHGSPRMASRLLPDTSTVIGAR